MLLAGPPPVADQRQTARILALDAEIAEVCRIRGVRYAAVAATLTEDATWRDEVAAGDGSHPGSAGYRQLAELIWPTWCAWLGLDSAACETVE